MALNAIINPIGCSGKRNVATPIINATKPEAVMEPHFRSQYSYTLNPFHPECIMRSLITKWGMSGAYQSSRGSGAG